MVYLVATVFAYYLLMWGSARLLGRGSEERQVEQIYRLRLVVGLVYWLVNAPILFTGLLWLSSSRWSLSSALQPVWLVLLLLSGMVVGVYLRVAQLRWPLLVYALFLGLACPLWWVRNYGGILYEQYPYTVKASYRYYVEKYSIEEDNSFWGSDDKPATYSVTELHSATWGFDYYVGDIRLEYPLSHELRPQPRLEEVSDSIWQRVRLLHFSLDSSKGRLKFSPLLSAGKYNAFTDRVQLPTEQVVDFWVDISLAQRKQLK